MPPVVAFLESKRWYDVHERGECEGGALLRRKRASDGVVGGRPRTHALGSTRYRLYARSVTRALGYTPHTLGCTRARLRTSAPD
jgi:hypothetical protein